VSKAFNELPQSTEQILHPEKYFAHEAPVKVTLPDITSLLNAGSTAAGSASASSGRWAVSSEQSSRKLSSVSATQLNAGSAHREQSWSAATRRRFNLQKNHAQDARATWKRLDYDVEGEWGFYLILDEFLKSPVESRRAAAGWGGDRFAVYESSKGEVLMTSLSTWDTENDAREFFDAYVKRTELRYPRARTLSDSQSPSNTRLFSTDEGAVNIEVRGSRVLTVEGLSGMVDGRSLSKALWQ
jgi:hypothetical protein